MGLNDCLCWGVTLLMILMPGGSQCVSVHIQTPHPVHVIPEASLLLQARIEHGQGEQVSMVTWERESGHGEIPGKVPLATFPGKNATGRVSLDHQGATLRLERFTGKDSGLYTVTVTDQTGAKASAQCNVMEYVPVHLVSVIVNVSHTSLFCLEAWGTDPKFRWLHEGTAVTKATGHVSPDGKTLFFTSVPICGHFTCTVSNSLGHSSAAYTAEPCERESRATTVAVVCLVILLVLGGAATYLLWRRHSQHRDRGERLREHFEGAL